MKILPWLRFGAIVSFLCWAGQLRAQDGQNLAMERIALAKQGSVFLENKGQYVRDVKFLYRTKGLDMWLLGNAVVYDLHRDSSINTSGLQDQVTDFRHSLQGTRPNNDTIQRTGDAVRMEFENASSSLTASGEDDQPGIINYFFGNDSTKWATNVRRFGGARIQNLYDGIDASYYLDNGFPCYDLIVQPGADPSKICISFKGQEGLSIDGNGDLIIKTSMGYLVQQDLFAYQIDSGRKEPVTCRFSLDESGMVRFDVGTYDHSLPLVIDPLLYSSYLGGAFDDFSAESGSGSVAVDSKGNAYVAGTSLSNGALAYPVAYPSTPGAYQTQSVATNFGFVTKLNSTGTALIYSTYIFGEGGNIINAMALDTSGDVFIVGSGEIPTTPGTYLTSGWASFITKLNQSGNKLLYSTYFPAGVIRGLAIDPQGCAYIAGEADLSTPTTAGAYKTQYPPSQGFLFVAKFNASGSGLEYSTCFGGKGFNDAWSIALDSSENAYITGATGSNPPGGAYPTTLGAFQNNSKALYGFDDAFVTKLNSTGTDLVYSTLLGGGLDQKGKGIAVDGFGNVYVMGWATSTDGGIGNFPTTPNAFQHKKATPYVDSQTVFVTKLNSTGTALIYSTLLGGENVDIGIGFAIDRSGNACIAGRTKSRHYPITPDAFQNVNVTDSTVSLSNGYDAIVTELNATGSGLIYSTYLGGEADNQATGIALDDSGDIYVTGETNSMGTFPIGFPVTPSVFQPQNNGGYDVFVTKFGPNKGGSTALLSYHLDTLSLSVCESVEDSVSFFNPGGAVITIDSAKVNQPFNLIGGQLPFYLTPGAALPLLTRIVPDTAGHISAPLTLYYHTSDNVAHDSVIILNANVGAGSGQEHREATSGYVGDVENLPVAVDINSSINIDSLWPSITDMQFSYSWDSSVVTYVSYLPPAGWSVTSSSSHGNSVDIAIHNVSSSATHPLDLGTAIFTPSSSTLASSWVTLSNFLIIAGDQTIALCVSDNEDAHWAVKTLGASSSVTSVQVSTNKTYIYPNPATKEITVVAAVGEHHMFVIYDPLGRSHTVPQNDNVLDISLLPAGVYFVSDGMSGAKFVKE